MINLNIITLLIIVSAIGIKKKHIITVLFTLELLSLLIILTTLNIGLELFVGIILLCIAACGGAVGLGAIIRVTRINTVQRFIVR